MFPSPQSHCAHSALVFSRLTRAATTGGVMSMLEPGKGIAYHFLYPTDAWQEMYDEHQGVVNLYEEQIPKK